MEKTGRMKIMEALSELSNEDFAQNLRLYCDICPLAKERDGGACGAEHTFSSGCHKVLTDWMDETEAALRETLSYEPEVE